MLNYVWVGLIIIGILSAGGTDIYRELNNSYQNGKEISATYYESSSMRNESKGSLEFEKVEFNNHYKKELIQTQLSLPITITTQATGTRIFEVEITNEAPQFWQEISKGSSNPGKIKGSISKMLIAEKENSFQLKIALEEFHYLKLRAVTNAAFDFAGTAVTLALGLIGVMALWLGIMKIAEESGFLKIVTKLVSPLTKKLFPEIPQDHPAIAAMVMNISANMLGLNNAATPMGLKAMEELNKLNPKLGTATNAMCTFLVINTAGLTIIPATVLAIRASMGSANPGIIIAPSIFGAGCATVFGIIAVKILQRMKRYSVEKE